jgi:uncharacterized protein YcbK (DUF882 family)
LFVTALFTTAIWAISISARAAGPLASSSKKKPAEPLSIINEYEVKQGDVLGTIAQSHGIRIEDLMQANDISDPDRVFAGRKLRIPGDPINGVLTKRGVRLNVPKGFTLSRIAAAYKIPVKKIVRANNLKNPDKLREDQKLLIPGAKTIVKLVLPPPCFKDQVSLYRVRTDETRKVPLCFCNGKPNPEAVDVLSTIAGPVGKKMSFPLHPRLLALLQKIAEEFQGRRIEIISGQRLAKRRDHESYHAKGQALDFRVEGVPNKRLANFVRKFDKVGVGYYPNSVFIHMDTRDRNAHWIDYSGPGEKPIYARAGIPKREIEQIREKRRKPVGDQITENAKASIKKLIDTLGKPKISNKTSSLKTSKPARTT